MADRIFAAIRLRVLEFREYHSLWNVIYVGRYFPGWVASENEKWTVARSPKDIAPVIVFLAGGTAP